MFYDKFYKSHNSLTDWNINNNFEYSETFLLRNDPVKGLESTVYYTIGINKSRAWVHMAFS